MPQPIGTVGVQTSEGKYSILLLSAIAFAYCTWILSLPVFPTQDGPMHLYYARIMQALIFHSDPGIYPQYFTIKHLFPPYSLYYYLLLLLSTFMSLVTADQVVICLYVVLFLFGFRFLARSVGPSGDIMALLVAPIVVNWPIGMGFVNFCLSTSLSLWALGLWCRVSRQPSVNASRRLSCFVALCFLIMLTHPVPLLGVLGFCGIELAIRLWQQSRLKVTLESQWLQGPQVRDALALVLASTTLLYVKAFTVHNVLRQGNADKSSYLDSLKGNVSGLLLLHTFTIFAGRGIGDLLYRGSVFAVLLFAVVVGLREAGRSLRAKTWTLADTWFAVCLLLIVCVPVIPPDLNNSHFFSARLVIWIWIAGLAGASGLARPSGLRLRWGVSRGFVAAGAFAVATTALILTLAVQRINPIARQIALTETVPLEGRHEVGLLLRSTNYATPKTITFDPYFWSGVRIFRREDSVLYNTPWLDLAIIPVGAQPVMPTVKIDTLSLEWGDAMRRTMLESQSARSLVFPQVGMTLINHGTTPFDRTLDPVLTMDPVVEHSLGCDARTIYLLCQNLALVTTTVPGMQR